MIKDWYDTEKQISSLSSAELAEIELMVQLAGETIESQEDMDVK